MLVLFLNIEIWLCLFPEVRKTKPVEDKRSNLLMIYYLLNGRNKPFFLTFVDTSTLSSI